LKNSERNSICCASPISLLYDHVEINPVRTTQISDPAILPKWSSAYALNGRYVQPGVQGPCDGLIRVCVIPVVCFSLTKLKGAPATTRPAGGRARQDLIRSNIPGQHCLESASNRASSSSRLVRRRSRQSPKIILSPLVRSPCTPALLPTSDYPCSPSKQSHPFLDNFRFNYCIIQT
jgi:hypothetical protein